MNLSRQNYWVNSSESTKSEETESDDEVVLGDNHEVYKIRGVPLFQGSSEEGVRNQKPLFQTLMPKPRGPQTRRGEQGQKVSLGC